MEVLPTPLSPNNINFIDTILESGSFDYHVKNTLRNIIIKIINTYIYIPYLVLGVYQNHQGYNVHAL